MIVSFSTIEDLGAGFRSKLLMPRWKVAKEKLRALSFDYIPALDARIVIGHVEPKRTIVGIEGPSFVVETRIPIEVFKQLSIREKADRMLDTIFESIEVAYSHFGEVPPPEIASIWQEARSTG